jgi:hypothetical protein
MKTERRTSTVIAPLVLRLGREEDTPALRRLACLDSALPLGGDVLLAVRGDEVAAAISLHSGRVVANPFQPTADLVALLRARVALLQGTASSPALGAARRLLRAVA